MVAFAQETRPPYVTFEVREEEDRTASQEAGHYVGKDVHYAYITPPGSKDRIERKVSDWFEQMVQQVAEERLPRAWMEGWKAEYKAWSEGQEAPLNGTSVKNWPLASPAQVRAMLSANVRTVEDMAIANEEVIGRLGMGGRALKDHAAAWLNASRDSGAAAAELHSLRRDNQSQAEQITKLAAQVERLVKELAAASPAK